MESSHPCASSCRVACMHPALQTSASRRPPLVIAPFMTAAAHRRTESQSDRSSGANTARDAASETPAPSRRGSTSPTFRPMNRDAAATDRRQRRRRPVAATACRIAACARASERQAKTTVAPRPSSAAAVSSPIPALEPVTTITWPLRSTVRGGAPRARPA
eukprot:scaffold63017_cov63-Phaeocystis_antarctica.AAC.2